MRAFCLSFHARYQCAHSGACCTAGWPIQLEHEDVRTLIPLTPDGGCVFFGHDGDRLCAIQRDRGAERMPVACRNFPRVTLRDARGIFVTLSHFCPTAARLLLHADDITIIEAPVSISLNGGVEGLDATAVMPPLLRRDMLMDLDGYTAWEHAAIAVLNDRRRSARRALDIIAAATRAATDWRPGAETLAVRVAAAFEQAQTSQSVDEAGIRHPYEHSVKAFLAAHLFASWAAYQNGGVLAVVDGVDDALTLVEQPFTNDESFIDCVRSADLRLRHTNSPGARHFSAASKPLG